MVSTGIIEVDIHGMTAHEAKKYIDNVLSKTSGSVYQIRVIWISWWYKPKIYVN